MHPYRGAADVPALYWRLLDFLVEHRPWAPWTIRA